MTEHPAANHDDGSMLAARVADTSAAGLGGAAGHSVNRQAGPPKPEPQGNAQGGLSWAPPARAGVGATPEQMDLLGAARQRGEHNASACADKAVRVTEFNVEHACVFVRGVLAEYGRSKGEDIVDRAAATSRRDLTPHDTRAWGQVFATLVRRKQIRCVGYCERRKGNGTAGGRVWELVL